MKLKNKKILVTGADGFIGSHLVEQLVCMGCSVKAMVMYNAFGSWGWLDQLSAEIKDQIEVIMSDVRDPYGVKAAMRGCDVVLHLAALIGIPYSYICPDSYIDTNIKGTLNVVQAARECNVEKIVHTSTSEVYGTARYVPIDEAHPLQGQSPYSASKIGADQIALSFHASFGLPVSVIRPFNTYGPRQSLRAFIPTVIAQINQASAQIQLGSLHPTRDFTYVTDTARAFIAVAESDLTVGEVVNAGSHFEITMQDTVKLIARLMQADITVIQDPKRVRPENSEVERLFADHAKIKKLTNWQPEFAGLDGFEKGLMQTIDWYINQSKHKNTKAEMYHV